MKDVEIMTDEELVDLFEAEISDPCCDYGKARAKILICLKRGRKAVEAMEKIFDTCPELEGTCADCIDIIQDYEATK